MKRVLDCLCRRWDKPSLFGRITIAAFVVAQILDGVMTYAGVMRWGLEVEANPLIVLIVSLAGFGPGLIMAKLAAIGFGALLFWKGAHNAVAVLVVYYLVIALLPWTYVFLMT